MLSRIFFLLTNNILVNNILIALKMDGWLLSKLGMYKRVSLDRSKSAQEMAGFSTQPQVQEAIDKTHSDLIATAEKYLKAGDSILDIGCGAGAYLQHFVEKYQACGIDLNTDMIEVGKKNFPEADFIFNDFIKHSFNKQFKLIYSISVLEFIAPGKLDEFFKKVNELLEPGGIFFLHYPHALNRKSLMFPDLYYIEYSPVEINKKAKQYFHIITHHHGFDGRSVIPFDKKDYGNGIRTFKNGFLLIAQKLI
jgi:cyclopropane fatty-acyl-phospholipid synthase-like methyltransferase